MNNPENNQKNTIYLRVKIDFPVDISAFVSREDNEFITISFSQDDLLNAIKEKINQDCFCRFERRIKNEKSEKD